MAETMYTLYNVTKVLLDRGFGSGLGVIFVEWHLYLSRDYSALVGVESASILTCARERNYVHIQSGRVRHAAQRL